VQTFFRLLPWSVLAAAAVLVSCTDRPNQTLTPDSSVFGNEALPEWRLAPAPRVTIGDDNRVGLDRVTAGLMLDETIVIANSGFKQVLFLSPDGEPRYAQGREGEGPGEYKYLATVKRFDDHTVVVWDQITRRLTLVTIEGELADAIPVRRPPLRGAGQLKFLGFLETGFFLFEERLDRQPRNLGDGVHQERRDSVLYSFLSARGDSAALTWAELGREQLYASHLHVFGGEPVIFGRDTYATAFGDVAAIAPSDSLTLTLVQPGRSEPRRVSLPWNRVPVTSGQVIVAREALLAENREEAENDPGTVRLGVGGSERSARQIIAEFRQELIEVLPARTTLPALSEMRADGDGNLWVRSYPLPEDQTVEWVVLDAELTPVARIVLPMDLEIFDIGRRDMLVHRTDEMDRDLIDVWPIVKRRG
jgi:hypothetical protein